MKKLENIEKPSNFYKTVNYFLESLSYNNESPK